jgi:nitrite reductase/ring-hydroxylating ferredoxin subunit
MKKYILIILLFGLFFCDNTDDNNQFLPNVPVNFTVNLNLSEGIDLQVPGGQAIFENKGISGIVVIRQNIDLFIAFDLACPHLEPFQDCSTMTVGTLFMVCPCDNERFQLTNGAAENGEITESARVYNVTRNGDIIRITN